MAEADKKEQTTTHKIGIYLWIWGLLFVLSFFSYMVDWYQFQGMLRWSLILIFMFLKAGLIMAFFMHLFWERYALVNVLLWPMTAIACFIFLMVAEFKYTLFTRLLYFFVGGGITAKSDSLKEWEETEWKFRPFLDALGTVTTGSSSP